MPSNNKKAVQGAENALNKMKYEIAGELGLTNYQTTDKGQLTSRQNGYVGGFMTRKMVQYAEEALKGQS